MKSPPPVADTGLGETRKVFGGARAALARIDVNDPDQVFDLAVSLQQADARRMMQVTHAEIRALARFAASMGVIGSQVARIIVLHDAGAKKGEIIAALDALGEFARP